MAAAQGTAARLIEVAFQQLQAQMLLRSKSVGMTTTESTLHNLATSFTLTSQAMALTASRT
jgi:hypothetical protein